MNLPLLGLVVAFCWFAATVIVTLSFRALGRYNSRNTP